MEGVERYKVRLLPHNPKWAQEYQSVKQQIKAAWGPNVLAVEHVGSTAIKGICAKPILDIAVRLKSIQDMKSAALIQLGYDYCGQRGGNPNYHLFVLRGKNQVSLRHIHCYDAGEKEFFQLVGFRDYLNAHPDAASQYAELKKSLAKQFPDDRIAYTAGKEPFILGIYAKMNR